MFFTFGKASELRVCACTAAVCVPGVSRTGHEKQVLRVVSRERLWLLEDREGLVVFSGIHSCFLSVVPVMYGLKITMNLSLEKNTKCSCCLHSILVLACFSFFFFKRWW